MTNVRRLFGTDGIRGTANADPMTAEMALRLGQAAGLRFVRGNHRHRVVIGKDTRLSGYMIEPALVAGFIGAGMDVTLVGPLPTPAIAMLTRSLRADLGVMISASHNPFEDNGIKLFGPDGFKLSDAAETEIEALMASDLSSKLAASTALGRAIRLDDAGGRYIESAKATFPRGLTLDGLRIVVDCAHGAAYKVAPTVLCCRSFGEAMPGAAITAARGRSTIAITPTMSSCCWRAIARSWMSRTAKLTLPVSSSLIESVEAVGAITCSATPVSRS